MTNIDQFESAFKAAVHPQFDSTPIEVESILVVTDEHADDQYETRIRPLFSILESEERPLQWQTIACGRFERVGQLLQAVGEREPDLICTYRNLRTPATEYPYSLGTYVDVLTQATQTPVMLTPHPHRLAKQPQLVEATSTVMAITDRLSGDHRLVSYAARMTPAGGTLWLTHVEDQTTFDRYIDAISKIPSINTDDAREKILAQLLKEANEYIDSCQKQLTDCGVQFQLERDVTVGRLLVDYKRLIENHKITLLVLNAKDEEQLAMHGIAYPLTVEMRDTPLLLL